MKNAGKTSGQGGLHYGYVVVFGGFLSQLILMMNMQAPGLMLTQIETTLNITHAAAGQITGIFGLTFAGLSFLWGWFSDRTSVKRAMICAGCVAGIFTILFGLFGGKSLLLAVFLNAMVGVGAAGIYSATVPKLIGAWFTTAKLGHAMRFINMGGTLCGLLLGLIIPVLSTFFGWEHTLIITGSVCLLICVILLFLIKSDPAEKGLTPVGSPPGTPVQPLAERNAAPANTFAIVSKMKILWHLALMFIFFEFAFMCVQAFLALSVTAAGYSVVQGGLAVTLLNLAGFIFVNIWGPLSDKRGRKKVIAFCAFCFTAAAVGYYFVWGTNLLLMYVFAFLVGVFLHSIPAILAAFSDYFVPALRGTANGVISTSALLGRYFGPVCAGLVADWTGQIGLAFVLAAAAMAISGVIALALPKPETVLSKQQI